MDSYQKGVDAAQAMQEVLSVPTISVLSNGLAFFAIMTSFLAQSLSLVHFLQDATKTKPSSERENPQLTALALVPPLIVAVLGPNLFFSALNFAGGICAMLLFGVLPVLMCWVKRYHRQHERGFVVFGGKQLLLGLLAFSIFVMGYQLLVMMGITSGV